MKYIGHEFAGVDLMQESSKQRCKTDSCYVTEVNGNSSTGIIDVTGHNHFLDLVKYVANRKAKKVKGKAQDTAADAQASAFSSYPTDMIHAGMTAQETVDAFAGLILNGATPEKMQAIGGVAEDILERASASEPAPVVDDLTKIDLDLYLGEDRRYKAQMYTPAPVEVKHTSFLSDVSAQALDYFKKINRFY